MASCVKRRQSSTFSNNRQREETIVYSPLHSAPCNAVTEERGYRDGRDLQVHTGTRLVEMPCSSDRL
jgi:hypothetical protein